MCSLSDRPVRTANHPVDKGHRSEMEIHLALVRRGYSVLVPSGYNHRYDSVIDCEGRFLRCQCKTGRRRAGVILFPTQSVRVNTKGTHVRDYRGQIDLFLVYCPDTSEVYAVPIEEVRHTGGSLRLDPTVNNQLQGIKWAADYVLPAAA